MKKLIAMLAVAAALCVSADSLLAQDNGGGNGGGNGGQRRNRGGGGFGQMDPAQRQQFMMDRYKEQLGFTNDTDWSAVEPYFRHRETRQGERTDLTKDAAEKTE